MERYNVTVKFLGKTYCAKSVEAKDEKEAQMRVLGTFKFLKVESVDEFPKYDKSNPLAAMDDILGFLKNK